MKNCHFVLAVAREPFGLRVQFVVIRVQTKKKSNEEINVYSSRPAGSSVREINH